MSYIDFLLDLYLPLLIFGVFVTLVIASELGYFLGRIIVRYLRKGATDNVIDENVSTITNSSLALLALFLGFTFSSALDHFEKNREAIIQESNAISTTYELAALQPEPAKTDLTNAIRDYLSIRLKVMELPNHPDEIRALQRESQLQKKVLWDAINQLIVRDRDSVLLDPLVTSMTNMFQAERTRTEYLLNGVPNGLFVPVGLFLLFNGVLLGISLGEGAKRHVLLSWGLYLLVSLAVGIIIDLDRPLKGFINVDQAAMHILKSEM